MSLTNLAMRDDVVKIINKLRVLILAGFVMYGEVLDVSPIVSLQNGLYATLSGKKHFRR